MLFMALAIAGALTTMYSQYEQGEAADEMANYNADVAKQEAKTKQAAILSQARQKQTSDRLELASTRARQGSSGQVTTAGSPLLQMAQMARENQYDQLEYARQIDIAGVQGENASNMYKWEGEQAKTASLISMGVTALGSVSALASSGASSASDTSSSSSGYNDASSYSSYSTIA